MNPSGKTGMLRTPVNYGFMNSMHTELSPPEKARYNRHTILPEIGMEGQLQLKNSSVLVIGAGGLGCPMLQYLAAAGIGKIGIVDFDTVDLSNLHRQILFGTADVGRKKAEVAKEKLLANNPHIQVVCHTERIEASNALEIIEAYQIVADGSDNFETRYLINDACVLLKKPLVFGAIFKFEGQLSVFNYQNGPSYRCLFPDQPKANSVPSCSQIGVMGVLPGIIGSLMANEVLKVALNRSDTLSGEFLTLDILSNQFNSFGISRLEQNFELTALGQYQDQPCEVIPSISVDELSGDYDRYFVLDIRKESERQLCQLPQSTHLDPSKLSDSISALPRDKDLVVYCHFGRESQQTVATLREQYGFNRVFNLEGGIHEWAQEIDNSVLIY